MIEEPKTQRINCEDTTARRWTGPWVSGPQEAGLSLLTPLSTSPAHEGAGDGDRFLLHFTEMALEIPDCPPEYSSWVRKSEEK